jgi:integrase
MPKRRGHGEGTVFHRKDGRWCAMFRTGSERLTHYAPTKAACIDWLHDMRRKYRAGFNPATANMALSDFMYHWLETARGHLRHNTWILYEQIIRDHIDPVLGQVKLDTLRTDHIQRLYALKGESVGPYTVRKIHITLHKALNQAVKWGIILRNPADLVERPPKPDAEHTVLTATQVQTLLQAARGTHLEALYHLAITTGMRQGEILGLRWSDFDEHRAVLQVRRQLQRQRAGGGLAFVEPKSKHSRRVLALDAGTVHKLLDHRERLRETRTLAPRWEENDLIFPSTVGTPMEPRNLYRQFRLLLKKAGLPAIRFHDLRHTSATLLLSQDIHPKMVQERLGHSQIGITLDLYSHVMPTMQRHAADVIGQIVSPDGPSPSAG